jgi:Uma2 family endonuclease
MVQVDLDPIATPHDWSMHVNMRGPVTRAEYRAFCEANPDLRIERTAEGELIVMAPANARSGNQNFRLAAQLCNWALTDGTGVGFDSSSGFDLPNGSNRSPDLSWIRQSRLNALRAEQRLPYPQICPDFVLELRSSSDRLSVLMAKMQEYIECGAKLGWLIDPVERRVWVYRPSEKVEALDEPLTLEAGPMMPGFVLDLDPIWNPQI